MNEATYATFSRAIHERHFGKRTPVEVSIEVTPNAHNRQYLETKRVKMGHLLSMLTK